MEKTNEANTTNPTNEKPKPSLWSIIPNTLGAACLKLYTDTSGLSGFLLGSESGYSSASSYAKTAMVITGVALVIGYFLSSVIVRSIDRADLTKGGKWVLKIFLIFGYFIGAIGLGAATKPLFIATADSSQTFLPESSSIQPVIAARTIQSAEGATQADFSLGFLNEIEKWAVEIMHQKYKNHYVEMGFESEYVRPKIIARSSYVVIEERKLGIIKTDINNFMRLITIIGINGAELHRVTCFRVSDHHIPVFSGVCGKKVTEAFNVDISRLTSGK